MRHGLSFVFLFFSACLLLSFISLKTDRHRYPDLLISGQEYSGIKKNRSETDRDLITEIRINEQKLFCDVSQKRWFYSLPSDINIDKLTLDYKSKEPGVALAIENTGSPNGTIPVIAYTQNEYKEYGLVLTTLPLLRIECENTEIKENDVPIRLTLIDNKTSAKKAVTNSDGLMHVRGKSTKRYEKKSFRLTLTRKNFRGEWEENDQSLLGLRSDGDWILYSLFYENEQEKIRNVFSSNLWFNSCAENNDFNIKNGMEYRYLELFLNDRYWGLYALGYPIDKKQMNITPNQYGHYEEFLYKTINWGPQTDDYSLDEFLSLEFDADENDQKYGASVIQSYFQYLFDDAPHGTSHNDEKNAIDIWLFAKLIQHTDGVSKNKRLKNFFIAAKNTETEGIKILYTPWDMDLTWGNRWDNLSYSVKPNNNSYEMLLNPVSIMLQRGDPISSRVKERYTQLRSDKWSDSTIDNMLDGFEQEIFGSGAYLREMERWPDGPYVDPEIKLSVFRDYIHKRFSSMDEYISNL